MPQSEFPALHGCHPWSDEDQCFVVSFRVGRTARRTATYEDAAGTRGSARIAMEDENGARALTARSRSYPGADVVDYAGCVGTGCADSQNGLNRLPRVLSMPLLEIKKISARVKALTAARSSGVV